MMDLSTIRHLAEEAGEKAAQKKREPFVPYDASRVEQSIRAIPNLGSYAPPGWKEVERLFVDKSGLGAENEPAMTFERFCAWVREHMPKEYGYGMVEEGQFQVYIGVFKRTEKATPLKRRRQRRREQVAVARAERIPPPGPAEKDLPPAKPGEVTFGTLTRGGLVDVKRVPQAAIQRCRFFIFDAQHYRDDGTCRCNDPVEQRRLIREAGYKRSDFNTGSRR